MIFRFWHSDTRGLIRQRVEPGTFWIPEVWNAGRWRVGSSYVMDAITGMGEDPYSCGEFADELSAEQAQAYASKARIDLFADNPDASHSPTNIDAAR